MTLPFNPFTGLSARIYGAAAIALLLAATAQTLRIEGALCRAVEQGEKSRCLFTGFKQRVADQELVIDELTAQVFAEQASHRATKQEYRAAQEDAAQRDAVRIDRVKAQQQEITDEVVADYRRRLADARAAGERLRQQASGGAGVAGAADREPVPGAGDPANGAAAAAGDRGLSLQERLIATEQALQLDALIDWVLAQSEINPNTN